MIPNKPFLFTIKYIQYGVHPEADQYVHQCYVNADGATVQLSTDMSDWPDEVFFAVETKHGWKKIENLDFVVLENDKPSVYPLALFLLPPLPIKEIPKPTYGLCKINLID